MKRRGTKDIVHTKLDKKLNRGNGNMTDTKQISDAIKGLPDGDMIRWQSRITIESGEIATDDLKALVAENESLKEQVIKHTTLFECVSCGQPSFAISPLNDAIGFCWNERIQMEITTSASVQGSQCSVCGGRGVVAGLFDETDIRECHQCKPTKALTTISGDAKGDDDGK